MGWTARPEKSNGGTTTEWNSPLWTGPKRTEIFSWPAATAGFSALNPKTRAIRPTACAISTVLCMKHLLLPGHPYRPLHPSRAMAANMFAAIPHATRSIATLITHFHRMTLKAGHGPTRITFPVPGGTSARRSPAHRRNGYRPAARIPARAGSPRPPWDCRPLRQRFITATYSTYRRV